MVSYIGSLFVENCPADDILQHFQISVSNFYLDATLLMDLGMDGTTVNISFQKKCTAMFERE